MGIPERGWAEFIWEMSVQFNNEPLLALESACQGEADPHYTTMRIEIRPAFVSSSASSGVCHRGVPES